MLRFDEQRILHIKRALNMTESAFSHALRRLEEQELVETSKVGREKIARLTGCGRLTFSSLQALCYTLGGTDGSLPRDDEALEHATNFRPPSPPEKDLDGELVCSGVRAPY